MFFLLTLRRKNEVKTGSTYLFMFLKMFLWEGAPAGLAVWSDLIKKLVLDAFIFTLYTQYTQSVLIRNGPIRHTSEIFGFLKKLLVKFERFGRNTTSQFF